MRKKSEGTWLEQMYVYPEQGDKAAEYEHDYPYLVEYNPETGDRRTSKLSQEQVDENRARNGLPAEEVKNSE